jgi:transcriptional regulator with XRE-family HTH domain
MPTSIGYKVKGKKIRYYRLRKKHWRQQDLADATGLRTGTISRIETGWHNPQLSTVDKIADALGVDADIFLIWDEEEE